MRTKIVQYPIVFIAVFIWIGFVCAISFMEAWLKFRVANVTMPIGLSIGRVVFGALNKVEWTLALIIMAYLAISRNKMTFFQLTFFSVAVLFLVIQTFFLLPALNERVEVILLGRESSPSLFHFWYLTMEIMKVICLFIFGVGMFRFHTTKLD